MAKLAIKGHPTRGNEGLASIDKVCAYLESLTYQDYPGGPMERIVDDYIIKDLRKAMEG